MTDPDFVAKKLPFIETCTRELEVPPWAAAGCRNLVVHGYGKVDLLMLRDVAENRLGDLHGFVKSVRKRLPRVDG